MGLSESTIGRTQKKYRGTTQENVSANIEKSKILKGKLILL